MSLQWRILEVPDLVHNHQSGKIFLDVFLPNFYVQADFWFLGQTGVYSWFAAYINEFSDTYICYICVLYITPVVIHWMWHMLRKFSFYKNVPKRRKELQNKAFPEWKREVLLSKKSFFKTILRSWNF